MSPSDHQLEDLYAKAETVLFFGHEDFGIVPVEAATFGTPVCALGVGGVTDTVVDGVDGVTFPRSDPDDAMRALQRCLATDWDHEAIGRRSAHFSVECFLERAGAWIRDAAHARELDIDIDERAAERLGFGASRIPDRNGTSGGRLSR
ncbi:MAG: glycosyltransferase [Actinomycetota bacterium]|nr:glycosyltransferase [Actinomycetota bacterium]